ncbi:hypothetical protein JCM10296v2_005148 [Rhodotorula toruloides]
MAEEVAATPHRQELIVLAGVVGSGKSTLSQRWEELMKGWVRVNQDDLGDRRTCENMARARLGEGYSVLVDRQNFDAGQRKTWVEIASEFPEVEVGCMVMGTSKEDCRERLLVRQDHPTIDNPDLAVQLLDKFSSLWQEPMLDEGFDRLITLPPLPLPAEIDAALIQSLLDLLHASPLNPSARQQRQPRPREPYRRPDGFVDDGTWRPPPRGAYGQRGGYSQSVQYQQPPRGGHGYYDAGRGAGYTAGGGGWQGYGPNPAAHVGAQGTQVEADKGMHHEADIGSKEQDTPGGKGSG